MTPRIDTKTRWALLFVGAGALALASATGTGACVQQPNQIATGGFGGSGGSGGDGSGTGGGAASNKGKEMFSALEQDLYDACGSCHDVGGIADTPFLAGPDRYQSIVSWPEIIKKDPSDSILITYPSAGPQHPYKKIDASPLSTTLKPKLEAWLAEEAKGIVIDGTVDAAKIIEPKAPIIGFNAIYLDALGDEFVGMALTFTADLLDESALALTNLEVHPTASAGLHVVHPLFVVYPKGASPDPDPVDSFSNVDQTFNAGVSGTLGPGTMIVTNWKTGAKLSVAFEKVEVVGGAGDAGADGGGPTGGCKDVASFDANARPALKANCTNCHGGNSPQAKGALDMSKIDSDVAAACGQVLNRVNPADPPSSQIFITTNPNGNAAHPYKFGGNTGNYNNFMSQLTTWIQAEQ